MSQPPPLAPVPLLTSNGSKKRNATQSGMTNGAQHQPPNKKYKTAPNTMHTQYVGYPPQQYPPNQNYHQEYYDRHSNSTQQYYDRRPPIKSPTPQIEMIRLKENNNGLPQRILMKIREAEQKSMENKANTTPITAMIPIGTCYGFVFGPIEMAKDAQPGDVTVTHKTQTSKKKNKQSSLCIFNANDVYLGQCDTKLVAVFAEFIKNKKMKTKAKIIEADLSVYKKRLPPNRFVNKLQIEIFAEYDIILNIVENTRKKVKKWKWIKKEVILSYFEGDSVEYSLVFDEVVCAIHLTEAYSGNILQLEANFSAAFASDIIAGDLEGIDPFEDIVETKLLQHQRVGLEWMILRENFHEDEDDIPPFFQEIVDNETGDIKYVNLLNDCECDDLPEIGCGGILADDMGLGKTLQCIALIASNSDYQNDIENGSGPTLIVAPLTVIGNWVDQIKQHCAKDSFKIMIYHGPNREKDLSVISSHNIVITTFDIVALEYSDEDDDNREEMRKHYGCGLQYVEWLRVVLDEAHKIRSRKTRAFKACNALQSKSRWCLTGTPVQNRLDDLYSLFCFLKLQPICDKSFWNKFIIQPLKNNNSVGFDRLRIVMKQLCLRRDKKMKIDGKPIISIPDKVTKQRILEFSASERNKYLHLMAIHKAAFNRMKQLGDKEIMRNFSSVLSMLLRLRQCCAHTLLVPQLNGVTSLSAMTLSDVNIDTLEDANQECCSCGMKPEGTTLTTCNHIYCDDCFYYELETHNGSFPCTLCGDKLTKSSIVEKREKDETKEETKDDNNNEKKKKRYKKFVVPKGKIEPSTKMQALISDVKSWKLCEVGGAPNKAVVFSQWTSVLDLLAACLDDEEILFERLDGTMTRATREAAMERFRIDDSIPVFLMSLKAGNLGVNMTVANHVYMLDPWWNPATEDQAVDRVYRLGQKRNVIVNHFVIKDSVEEKILQIQQRKRKLISSALGQSKEDMKQERKKEWLEDLKELFTSK